MSDDTTPDDEPPGGMERDEVLALLDDAMGEAHEKVMSGRVYDVDNEKARQGWFRTLGYLANQYRSLKKDAEIQDLAERLEALEEAQSSGSDDYRVK